MQATGTTLAGPELLVELRRDTVRSLRAQLEDGLRDAVRSGRLAASSAMPSSRTLARDLAVSRRLVVEAYAQLVAEGYLLARRGAGTFVATTGAVAPAPVRAAAEPAVPRFDFFPGAPDLSAFPRADWSRAVRDVLRTLPAHALGYSDPRGAPALRTALAAYLARARGVVADPQHIVVLSGATQGLALLAAILARRGTPRIVVEEPGLPRHRELLAHHGAEPVPLPVDEHGLRVEALEGSGAAAVLVTAAHQMPTGVALSLQRRAQLLAWDGLIVEDDYDAEFRYDRAPLAALQGLAPQRVAYLGSASKTLAPGLRLAWIVAPQELARDLAAEKLLADSGTDVIGQHTLARLIETGAYDRHLRVMRRRHRARRDAFVAALARHVEGAQPLGIAAGLHALVRLPWPIDPVRLTASCERRSLRIYSPHPRALALGYANVPEAAFDEALRRLAQALDEARVA